MPCDSIHVPPVMQQPVKLYIRTGHAHIIASEEPPDAISGDMHCKVGPPTTFGPIWGEFRCAGIKYSVPSGYCGSKSKGMDGWRQARIHTYCTIFWFGSSEAGYGGIS